MIFPISRVVGWDFTHFESRICIVRTFDQKFQHGSKLNAAGNLAKFCVLKVLKDFVLIVLEVSVGNLDRL